MRTLLSSQPFFVHKDKLHNHMKGKIPVTVRTKFSEIEDFTMMLEESGLEHTEVETEVIGEDFMERKYAKSVVTLEDLSDLFSLTINMGRTTVYRGDKSFFDIEIWIEG